MAFRGKSMFSRVLNFVFPVIHSNKWRAKGCNGCREGQPEFGLISFSQVVFMNILLWRHTHCDASPAR